VKVSEAVLAWYSKVARYDYLSLGYIKYFKVRYNKKSLWFPYHAFMDRTIAQHCISMVMYQYELFTYTFSVKTHPIRNITFYRDGDIHEIIDTLKFLSGITPERTTQKRYDHTSIMLCDIDVITDV
jgi:hypothetical protein